MQSGGKLAGRIGSSKAVIIYASLFTASIIPIGVAQNVWQLAIILIIFGFGNGGLDVSMNLQAAALEVQYKRPIMSAFHGFASLGLLVGSLFGALALHLGG